MQAERPNGPETGPANAALWNEHGDAVGRVCTALLGDAVAAQAAVEETFVAALEGAAAQARPHDVSVRGWLFGIARSVCARRLETGTSKTLESADTRRDPVNAHERARLALAELKPTEREALVLWRVGGLSAAEIAQACKTDEATARARVSKGLAKLRASLGDET